MRIKTTKQVSDDLDNIRYLLKLDNNAYVLRLAINMAIHNNIEITNEIKEDGFSIDTHILFADDAEYYKFMLIKLHPGIDYKTILLNYIEQGFNILRVELRYAKNDPYLLMERIINVS